MGNILTANGHTYTYSNSTWGNLLTAYDGQTISYDTIGNPTSYYNGYRYTMSWTEGRKLASLTYNGQTTSYQYDHNGIRTKKTKPDGSYTCYEMVAGKAVGETRYNAAGNVSLYMRYTFDESGNVVGISLWYPGDTVWTDYYFAKNLQGDVLAVYAASDNTCVAAYTYDAWGNILTQYGSLADINPFRYRGYYYDNESWFYYLQSRYYDPSIGRFINADALVSTGQGLLSNNMFAYCNNNAVNFKDPDGKEPITATISLAVVIGALVITVVLAVAAYYTVQVLWEIAGWISESIQTALDEISYTKKATEPEPPDVTYPGDDPAKAPDGYEWRGPDEQGGKRGGYSNPNGKDSWHPDLDHPDGVDPHWDYNDGLGHKWRVYPKHIEFVP